MLIERVQKPGPDEHKFYSVFLREKGLHVGYFEIKNINHRHKTGTGSHIIPSPSYSMYNVYYDIYGAEKTVLEYKERP
jgi:hypothetical protein